LLGQEEQVALPFLFEKVPEGQILQLNPSVTYVPTGHSLHTVEKGPE
jgi:hypothetical protein